MAISKVVFNGDTLMDVTQDTVAANNLLSGETATGANGLRVSGSVTVPTKTSDLTNDGADGTHPFISDAGVTSFNGATGAVTYTAPVTSVNGSTGAVTVAVPTKTSDLTNDSGFITDAGVTSFNGSTGAVTYTAPVTSVNTKTGAVSLTASDVGAGTYSKPSGGIPSSDLSSAVQTSLGKADTALQSAPVTSVNGQTGTVALSIPAATSDLTNDSGFITSSDLPQDWFSLGTKITSGDLDDYQTAGRYFCEANAAANITHKPTSSAFAMYVAPIYNQWRPFQLAFDFDARFYVRVLTANGWTGWTTTYPLLNDVTQTTAGVYALDAAVGKSLADAMSALASALGSKKTLYGDTAVPSGANLNNYTSIGTYSMGTNAISQSLSNCPITVAGKLVVEGGTTPTRIPDYLRQTVTPYNAQDIYIRTSINSGGTWSAWKKVTLANA